MTTSHLPRRAVIGTVLAASLIGTGLVASFAAEAPCTTFTDPKGDSAPADAPMIPAPEDDLDITGVAFDTVDTNLVVSLYVAKLNIAPEYSLGDSFKVSFSHGGKAVGLYAYRYNPTEIGDVLTEVYPQTGMTVAGSDKPTTMKVTYDTKSSKVVYSLPLAEIEKATATPTAGASFSTLAAEAAGDNILFAEPWDTAAAAKDVTYAVGSLCGGGAAAPAPAATASAAPSPSTSPSAAPAPPAAGAPATGGDPLKDRPAADCATFKDPKGDAIYNNTPNDPDLDMTAVTMRTTADAFVTYIKVDKLADKPSATDGHRFYSEFTFNKHVFSIAASSFSSYGGDLRDGASQTGQVGPTSVMSVDSEGTGGDPGFTDAKVTSVFDVKTSTVVLSVPLAAIEKHGQAPTAGATFTAVQARAGYDSGVLIFAADTVKAEKPADAVYVLGDNKCFAPPVPPLSSVGAVKAQYGDVAAVAAKLVDAAGAPVAGKPVTFTLGASKATGVTGADGVAKGALTVKDKAGARKLTIDADGATTSVDFTVLVEKTALKAVNNKGTLTATLTDDDKKPVAGQVVTFTSGSKKVSAKTDAKGVAKASGLPAGNIKVTYAGATGMYTAASTTTK